MDFKVVITHSARADLGGIAEYIARDNPDAALAFGRALIAKAKSLASQPLCGRTLPLKETPDVRQLIHAPYRILYSVDDQKRVVTVLRFWHGARGEPKLTDEG